MAVNASVVGNLSLQPTPSCHRLKRRHFFMSKLMTAYAIIAHYAIFINYFPCCTLCGQLHASRNENICLHCVFMQIPPPPQP